MRGARRAAILALVAGASAALGACEALVGITDRNAVAPGDSGAGPAETGGGDTAMGGPDVGPASDTGSTPSEGSTDSPPPVGDGGDSGSDGADATASDADTGVTADATGDARDAMSATDARDAGDGGDGAVADPDVPCSQQVGVAFCDDFDTSAVVSDGWDFTNILADSGTDQLDTVTWVSAPKSALFVVSPVPGGVGGVQIGKTLSPFPGGVRLALDVRVENASYANFPQTAIAQLYVHQGTSAQTQINVNLGPGNTSTLQAYPPDAGAMTLSPAPPAPMTWTRVVLSYKADGTLSLIENGVTLGSLSIGAGAAGTALVITGAVYVNPSGTATPTFEIDNVVVKAQ
jgi:hypothetical protein